MATEQKTTIKVTLCYLYIRIVYKKIDFDWSLF